jgi:hypothetical protein
VSGAFQHGESVEGIDIEQACKKGDAWVVIRGSEGSSLQLPLRELFVAAGMARDSLLNSFEYSEFVGTIAVTRGSDD